MHFFGFSNVPSVFLISLTLLASAQRPSNKSPRDLGPQELARQNQITTRILEAYIQKKLGLARNVNPLARPPSIMDILPKKQVTERPIGQLPYQDEAEAEEAEEVEEKEENFPEKTEEYNSDLSPIEEEGLQSVESEQIDSVYSGGT